MAARKIGEYSLLAGFMVSSILILSSGRAFASSWNRHIYNFSSWVIEFEVNEEYGSVWFKCPGEKRNGGWRRDSCRVPASTDIEITYTTTRGKQESYWTAHSYGPYDERYRGSDIFNCRALNWAPGAGAHCSDPVPGRFGPIPLVEVKVNKWFGRGAGGDITVLNIRYKSSNDSVDMEAGAPIATPGTGTVYGLVVDRITGQGVPWATITLRLNGSNTATESTPGPDGSFLFDNLAPGEYSIIAIPYDSDYMPWIAMVTVEADLAYPVQMFMRINPSVDSSQ